MDDTAGVAMHTVGFCSAAATLSRPPDLTTLSQFANGSAELMIVAFSDAAERFGLYELSRAAAPATCGDAIDVPVIFP